MLSKYLFRRHGCNTKNGVNYQETYKYVMNPCDLFSLLRTVEQNKITLKYFIDKCFSRICVNVITSMNFIPASGML